MKDLLQLIPNVDTSHETGFCAQTSAFTQYNNKSGKDFYDWEKEIATPALQAIGATKISWSNGEVDSFGPLSRVVRFELNGKLEVAMYG